MLFDWLLRRKPKPAPYNPLANAPSPMRGDYAVLPLELDDFDWTDYDRAFLTVDGDGTVKLHSGYAWRSGITWQSFDYQVIDQISAPGASWIGMYWLRPSWYAEIIGQPAAIDAAWEVAS